MADRPTALFLSTILTTFLKWKRFKILYLCNPAVTSIKHPNLCLKQHKTWRVNVKFPLLTKADWG
jgi:hypothetical protein